MNQQYRKNPRSAHPYLAQVATVVILLLLATALYAGGQRATKAAEREEPVRVIAVGDDGARRAAVHVIKSREDLEGVEFSSRLKETISKAIDFRNQAAIVVFAGTRTSGGYRLRLEEYDYTDQRLIIRIAQDAPAPDAIVTQAITYPHIVISVAAPPPSIVVDGPRPR